jgi:hypothetical protein
VRRAGLSARLSLALALGLGLVSCKDKGPVGASLSGSAAPDPEPVPSARRPLRRYYLSRTGKRCEIYFADPGLVSKGLGTPCPGDLQDGERIRIAGMTCVRESSAPYHVERVEPVVCPDPLTNFERRDGGAPP